MHKLHFNHSRSIICASSFSSFHRHHTRKRYQSLFTISFSASHFLKNFILFFTICQMIKVREGTKTKYFKHNQHKVLHEDYLNCTYNNACNTQKSLSILTLLNMCCCWGTKKNQKKNTRKKAIIKIFLPFLVCASCNRNSKNKFPERFVRCLSESVSMSLIMNRFVMDCWEMKSSQK